LGIGLFARFLGLYASEPLRGLFIFGMCSSILFLRVVTSQFDTNCDYSENECPSILIIEANTRKQATAEFISLHRMPTSYLILSSISDSDIRLLREILGVFMYPIASMYQHFYLAKEDPDRNASFGSLFCIQRTRLVLWTSTFLR
jgi:hypothetical protein